AVGLLSFILNIYFWALIISIVASFIAPFSAHPALVLVRQLTEPIMAPFRRILPAMGGLDLSPIFVFLALQVIRIVLISPVGVNPAVVLGL
ncbi:MAG: YggT family protein, partial [Pseudomonas sp.]